jgi:hypothetical protein
MPRMQEIAFTCFKFQTFFGGVHPQTPPHSCVVCWPHTWPSAIAIPLKYIISQKGPFSKNAPPHGKILKKGPGMTSTLVKNKIMERCVPILLTLKRPLVQYGMIHGLLLKLLESKIGSRFYDLIGKSVLQFTMCSKRSYDIMTLLFSYQKGIRPRGILSLLLFDQHIYILTN